MLPGKTYSPADILRVLWRRRWLYLLPFAVGLAAAPYIASYIPERYRSETLIRVIPQRIPEAYVRSTVTEGVEGRLRSISDQIKSRSRLERIITELDLYTHERALGIMEDVVQQLRDDINIKLEGLDTFRITYVSGDPEMARKVTERLASLVIEENLRERESLADGTSQFLESQLEEAKRRLLEHEKKLEEYRRQYAGQLPSQVQSNLQAIQNAQLQMQGISESLNRARERRLLIERQIADAELPVHSGGTTEAAAPQSAAEQLEAAKTRLEAFKLRYTPDHPDVRALARTIRDLEVKAAEEAQQRAAPSPKTVVAPAEAVRQRRLRDLKADLDIIDGQVAKGQAAEADLKRAIAEYQSKIEVVPTRESELVELTRDYGTLQATYTSLLDKRESSKLAANLERKQIGEQFKILDVASRPERPSNRLQRIGFSLGAAAGGLVLGLALAGFLEYRNSSFTRGEEVERILSLPVIALIPALVSERDQRTQNRRRVTVDVAGVCVLLACVALLVLWPLRS